MRSLAWAGMSVLLMAGCTAPAEPSPPHGASAEPLTPAEVARQKVLAGLTEREDGPYQFYIDNGTSRPALRGSFSSANNRSIEIYDERPVPGRNGFATLVALRIGQPLWVKVELDPSSLHRELGIPTGFLRIDQSRLPPQDLLPQLVDEDGGDVAGLREIVTAASNLREEETRLFSGTVDLRTVDPAGILVPRSVVDGLGERALVPLRLTFGEDRELRLNDLFHLTVTLPDGEVHRALYHDFDRTVLREAPTNAEPAPDAVYDLLEATAPA
ncbi:hypothetical protein FHR83_003611 [Actinoplanes campanulatus]|uniref:Lipoprotein LprG n=1 Tax=Actinoplanes campanulatus TaxID=113559 RepID=A0A7W5AGK8_9ACTN|nr:hypothetical protein [Actinoplanes campanulatus]MBB3095941.1 hypothetical protein [Actinoplanes campanulatus]GGN12578.1 hypothetical protein GCM10010109_23240 [Actinoplanes campanulatus]GID36964.1 hypothetical protein Aca09nite_34700 [Actinoplanes campanulatus]